MAHCVLETLKSRQLLAAGDPDLSFSLDVGHQPYVIGTSSSVTARIIDNDQTMVFAPLAEPSSLFSQDPIELILP